MNWEQHNWIWFCLKKIVALNRSFLEVIVSERAEKHYQTSNLELLFRSGLKKPTSVVHRASFRISNPKILCLQYVEIKIKSRITNT